MNSTSIVGIGSVGVQEQVKCIKPKFLSFLRGNAHDPGVIDTACHAARRACQLAGLAPDRIELIMGASMSFTNFTAGYTQVAPRLSWGVHKLLKSKNAYAYDVCATDGLMGLESARAYLSSGMCHNAVVVAADQFPGETDCRPNIQSESRIHNGAAAAVVARGESGFVFLSSAFETGKLPCDCIRFDLEYGSGPSPLPRAELVIERKSDCAREMARLANRVFRQSLDRAGVEYSDIDHVILPRWGTRFHMELQTTFAKSKTEIALRPDNDLLISPAAMTDLLHLSARLPRDARVAVIAYGFGLTAGCQIFQWKGWNVDA